MTDTIKGSCVCGAVRYTIEPDAIAFQYCHCSRCRKATGSAFGANLFVPASKLTWEAGQDHVRRFELPDAKYWSRCFCEVCGSSLPWLTRTGKAYVVPAGTLDDDPGVRPKHSIYHAHRAPWYVDADELLTFEEGPPRR